MSVVRASPPLLATGPWAISFWQTEGALVGERGAPFKSGVRVVSGRRTGRRRQQCRFGLAFRA